MMRLGVWVLSLIHDPSNQTLRSVSGLALGLWGLGKSPTAFI